LSTSQCLRAPQAFLRKLLVVNIVVLVPKSLQLAEHGESAWTWLRVRHICIYISDLQDVLSSRKDGKRWCNSVWMKSAYHNIEDDTCSCSRAVNRTGLS
jgi:hypothetical protein